MVDQNLILTLSANDVQVREVNMSIPGRARSRELNHGAPIGWKLVKPTLTDLPMLRTDRPLMFAIVSTWHDADIITATVKNCLDNGCEEVYILDNNSPDDTVEKAEAAGAKISKVYETEYYDDDLRIKKQNTIAEAIVTKHNHREVWVITLDADELPIGYCGESIQETLGRLPGEVRTIGSNAIDLYPQQDDVYVDGTHPACCFAYGINRTAKFACNQHHWKHVAIRYFNSKFDIAQSRGNHYPARAKVGIPIMESKLELPIFHTPLRNRVDAERRLTALCGKKDKAGFHRSAGDDDAIGSQGAIKRFNSLDSIYCGRWHEVELPHSQMYGRQIVGICPYPWRTLHPELSSAFPDYQIEKPTNLLQLVGEK